MHDLEQARDPEDALIEVPQGYAVRLLLQLGPVQERADELAFDARSGVTPAMADWTSALGGLALFALRGEQGALLIQDRRAAGARSDFGVFRVVQDPCTDAWPWRDSSQSAWRVLRPPTSALLERPLRCEIAGVAFVSGQRAEPDERIIVHARTRARFDASWRLEWPTLARAGYTPAAVVRSHGANFGPAPPAAV